jgi:uracil-DNA glycosylase
MFFELMDQSWQRLLASHEQKLGEIENQVLKFKDLAPAANLVMRAFELPVSQVRVLVLGQDPYPTNNAACGLAFAV